MLALMKRRPDLVPGLARRVAEWYARRAVNAAPRPLTCGVYLTNRCNLTCEMCNIFRHPDQSFLDADFYRRLVEGLGRVGCFYLSFAGGEPLLDPTLGDRVRLARKHIPYVHLVTNGISLTERRVRELVDAGLSELSISLDGLKPDHDRIRGLAGAFEKTMKALDAVQNVAPELPVVVNTVISPSNLATIGDLANLIRDRGLMHKFQPVNSHPEFAGMDSAAAHYTWTPEQVNQVRAFLEEMRTRDNIVNSPWFLAKIPAYFEGKTEGGLFTAPCQYGTHHIEVTSDARLHPCLTATDWKDGFALERELEEVLDSDAYRKRVQELEACTGCKTNMYICNFEPRLAFPLGNFLRYRVSALLEPMS